jgi:alanine dehydrogenase
MKPLNIGILREGRIPHDRRVALTPNHCMALVQQYPHITIYVQPSHIRCFPDEDYSSLGFQITEDLSHCDLLFGVKEVQISNLIADKTYFFFSHTIKKQPYNRSLLQTIMQKNIRLIDYECLTDVNGDRVIAFGRYAGIVGAYNGVLTYGQRYGLFQLKRAYQCIDFDEVKSECEKIVLPPIKILITGNGRVAKGAKEMMAVMNIKQVSVDQYLYETFTEPVYVQLNSEDYHVQKQGKKFNNKYFHEFPHDHLSSFYRFTKVTDLLLACAYWHPHAPLLFTKDRMKQNDFKIKVIADITCDINGSIPATMRASSIEDPFYDYNPKTEQLDRAFVSHENITLMAVDNLPGELPRNASNDFGEILTNLIIPNLLAGDTEKIIERATITQDGVLTDKFNYLQDYVNEG